PNGRRTAPSPPAANPAISEPAAAPTVAPTKHPLTMRAMNPGGALRLGVFGSLSLINSPIASRGKMIGVYLNPIKAMGVPDTANSPIRAAQLVTAGDVMVHSPDTIPSTNATRMNMRVSFLGSDSGWLRAP